MNALYAKKNRRCVLAWAIGQAGFQRPRQAGNNKKEEEKMTLSEIAEKVGVPVVSLTLKSIQNAREAGKITRTQEENLLAELKKADGIWKNPVAPDIKIAKSLW
ncbi:MAG: hypothetical protein V1801_00655 [Candidatus Falkowbacteria bacterium]